MSLLKRIISKFFPKYGDKSYSQCGEDIIVNFILENYFGISKPVYLDVGANHPKKINNTYFFYKRGCSGVLVEPDKNLCKGLIKQRGRRDTVLNLGVGAKQDKLTFYKMSINALSSFSLEESEKIQETGVSKIISTEQIDVIPINDVLKKHNFNFVSVDVEGVDDILVDNWDFEKYRPEVICIETVEFKMGKLGKKKFGLISKIEKNGYKLYADTYINSIFIRSDKLPSKI
jgi:FkbM family methyltransferase